MHAGLDPAVIGSTFAIAVFGWHASLDLARRAHARSGWSRSAWLATAAGSAGLAIWSMHIVAFLSVPWHPPVAWDAWSTILALLMSLLSAWFGLSSAGRLANPSRSVIVALVMGAGLCATCPIGMTGLRGVVPVGIDPLPLLLSLLLATLVSSVALLGNRKRRPSERVAASLLAALFSTAMLWSSLRAATFQPAPFGSRGPSVPAGSLAAAAGFCSILVSMVGWLAALFDRRLQQLAARSHRLHRQNEERLRRVLEQLPFGIIVADVATKAVVFSNREADRVLAGLDRQSARSGFFPSAEGFGDPLSRALRDEEIVDRELQTFRRGDGSSVTLEISASPICDQRSQVVTAIAAFQDVSARVQAEADLRQAQKMEALGQLTGGIAHDTNNLLTAILGNLDLLEQHLVDEQQRALLRNALSATERGAKLPSQLLGYSRRQSHAPCPVDVNRVVRDMHPLLASTIGGAIRIEASLGADLWPAYADPTQLELVLLNLSINARDAMPAGGAIHVATSNVVLAESRSATDPPPGDYVALHVRDGGTGMDDATLARAFEPFFSTKGPGRGSGLGLSQVLGIAQQLGGGVRITSKVGAGTTVQLFMPRSRAQVQAPALTSSVPDRSGALDGKTILLVDDDDDVRTAARALLGQFGCIVIEETNGRSAVARVAGAERIDMALIDFAMPGLTGADAGERMRAIRPGLPILVITGYADAEHLPGVEGRFPTLQKPFRGAQLAELLPTLLPDQSRPAGTAADRLSVVAFQPARLRARDSGAAPMPLHPFSRRDLG